MKKDLHEKAIKLYLQSFSISQIAKILGVSKSTVWEWVQKEKEKENPTKIFLPQELKDKIKTLLLTSRQEKGKTRVLSFAQIYRLLTDELKPHGITNRLTFYHYLRDFINEEFGGMEKLERKRRPAKEMSAYHQSKTKIKRIPGVVEIDATGYTWKGKNYFILLAREIWSGFIFEPYLLETKETEARHYNKAINQYDVAKFLINIFSSWGVPHTVRTDNELTLKSELITRGLRELGIEIERVPPYSPNSKLIERAIRDLKALMREEEAEDFETILLRSIQKYNEMEHNFEHFDKPVIPALLLKNVELKQVKPEKLRFAFAERFVRKVINNTITIDNQKYEFSLPLDQAELGRRKEFPEVVVVRFIDDLSKIHVYDKDLNVKLGEAVLFSEKAPQDVIELKEEKAKIRRVLRRKEKLADEMQKLEKELPKAKISEADLTNFLFVENEQEKREEKNVKQFDILKILAEGGEKWIH